MGLRPARRTRAPRRAVHRLQPAAPRGAEPGVEDRHRVEVEARVHRRVQRFARLEVADELLGDGRAARGVGVEVAAAFEDISVKSPSILRTPLSSKSLCPSVIVPVNPSNM